jgi:hypothetical protein
MDMTCPTCSGPLPCELDGPVDLHNLDPREALVLSFGRVSHPSQAELAREMFA